MADTVVAFYGEFASGDAAGACALLSERVRRRVASQAPAEAGPPRDGGSCERSLRRFMPAATKSGIVEQAARARVLAVRVDGSTATATVSFGTGPAGSLDLVREQGAWRVGGLPSQESE